MAPSLTPTFPSYTGRLAAVAACRRDVMEEQRGSRDDTTFDRCRSCVAVSDTEI